MSGTLHVVTQRKSGEAADVSAIRLILADSSVSFRRSLRMVLGHEPDLEIVGEATDLDTAVREARARRAQVVVLDLRGSDGSRSEAIGTLRELAPETAIVVMTMSDSSAFVDGALQAGALGFVLKDTADAELPEAVRRAARGETYVSPRIRHR